MSKNSKHLRFNIEFPPANSADENGVVALSEELTPSLVLSAYIRGIFPWHISFGKVFWYSPDPRAVLYPKDMKISKSLSKTIRNGDFEVRVNSDFDGVIRNCATAKRRQQDGSWIEKEFVECYSKLHAYGFAISIEIYKDGLLVGGLYGLRLKGIFFGESMFSLSPNSSKIALAYLCQNAKAFGIKVIDCQQNTEHLLSLGATEISRDAFVEILEQEFADELVAQV